MIMLSAVLTLGTGIPAYAAAEKAVTESAYEEAASAEPSGTGESSPQESALTGSETGQYAESNSENVQGGNTETAGDSGSDQSEVSADSEVNDKADSSAGKESAEASDSEAADKSDSASEDIAEGSSDTAEDAVSDSNAVPAKRAAEGNAAQNAAGLQILSISDNAYGKTGTSVTFHIEAVGDGAVSYQWQYKLAGSSTWKSPGQGSAKTADYTFALKTSYDNIEVHCIVTDQAGNRVVSETRIANVFAVTGQPVSTTATEGQTVNFDVSAIGQGLSYQWYFKRPGGSWKKATVASAYTESLAITGSAANNGTSYRCVVRDSEGNSITSSAATLTVQPAIEITGISDDYYGTNGTKASFHIDASAADGALTYQ